MRTRMVLIAATTGAMLATAATAAGAPPGAQYPWAQPWGVTPTHVSVQPSAQVPIVAEVSFTLPGTAYTWAQPFGWSPASAHAQPPASVLG